MSKQSQTQRKKFFSIDEEAKKYYPQPKLPESKNFSAAYIFQGKPMKSRTSSSSLRLVQVLA